MAAIIFPLGLLSEHHDMAAVNQFRQAGANLVSIYWSMRPGGPLQQDIHAYRMGYLTTDEFREEVRAHIPKLKVSDTEFDAMWQSRIVHNEASEKLAHYFTELKAQGHEIVLVSGTNELDLKAHQAFFEQLGIEMPRTVPSYQAHLLNAPLFELASEQLQEAGYISEEIGLVLIEPQAPPTPSGWSVLNPVSWLSYGVESFLYQGKEQSYQSLVQLADSKGMSCIEWTQDSGSEAISAWLETQESMTLPEVSSDHLGLSGDMEAAPSWVYPPAYEWDCPIDCVS